MVTDDPGTPGDGRWEINLAFTVEKTATARAIEEPLVDANYGVGDRLQLKLEAPLLREQGAGSGRRTGLGESRAGVKWRFYDAGASEWQLSTYPQLVFTTPVSRTRRAAPNEAATTLLLPLELERAFGNIAVNVEVGGTVSSRGHGDRIAGVVVGHQLSEQFEWMLEVHADSVDGQSAVLANIGARWKATASGTLLVAIGRDLHNALGEHRELVGYLGWQINR